MGMNQDWLRLHPRDNVGLALSDLGQGDRVKLEDESDPVQMKACIPFGHKFALARIPRHELVIKYGHPIGRALRDIEPGEWVHVHNLESMRARGDLKEGR